MRATVLALLLGTAGCGRAHVQLRPPAAFSPIDRRDAYLRLRPKNVQRTVSAVIFTNGYAEATVGRPWLILGDGRRLDYPEDLIPVVPEASATAIAGAEADEARMFGHLLSGVCASLAALGVAGIAIPPLVSREPNPWLATAGVGSILMGAGLGFIARYFYIEEEEHAAHAFANYDDDLRDQLRLCGEDALPCEDAPP